MFKRTRRNLALLVVFVICVNVLPLSVVNAQEAARQGLVFVCVELLDPGEADNVINPYLVTFRDADLTDHIFGFVIPEDAFITFYSDSTAVPAVGIYSIAPDAATGGYRRLSSMSMAYASEDTPGERACSVEYPEIIADDLLSTIPLRVSAEQVVVVQTGGDDLLSSAEILGVFTLHFRSLLTGFSEDFQVVQFSGGGIELSFPFLQEDIRFVLVANKEVRVRISYTDSTDDFLAQNSANPRSRFLQALAREQVVLDAPETLDLFQMMEEGVSRIYPHSGLILVYPTGGYLRLEMSPVAAIRDPAFDAGVIVEPIEGSFPGYVTAETGTSNTLNDGDTVNVVRIDENGQLIVSSLKVGEGATVDAWFLEVVTDNGSE